MLHCVFRCIFWKHVFCSLTCSCITWNRDESSIAWRTYGISSTVCPFFRSAIPDHLVAEVCRVAAFDPGPTSALLGRGETRGDSEVYGICQTSKGCVNQMPIVRFDPIWNIRINYSNSYVIHIVCHIVGLFVSTYLYFCSHHFGMCLTVPSLKVRWGNMAIRPGLDGARAHSGDRPRKERMVFIIFYVQ